MFEIMPWKRNNSISKRGDMFNQLMNQFFDDDFLERFNTNSFSVDLKEDEKSYVIEADLPGIKKEDICVEYNNGYLTISAKRDELIEDKKDNYVKKERSYGTFKRSFYVDDIDEDNIDAKFDNGVLNIVIPKLNDGKIEKKRIEIK
ncbi:MULTISPECIES: heat shock protein Hsp18 [Clostridium]|uniref:Hsp20/alpha crystallin family protein n=1 Tax=Clostridium faecium TaxID=2762223 RepID=A0ABR8YPG0_9CLOT|nr:MULTISPECIES: heat shock protein Hsp18 [Clostridium]MBD8046113.1 Hsp20/alpha crystallin family protein [Clostridium faecium]MDU1349564.1 heat shock protein Hsp18 [Clostridium argentinense]